MPVITNLEKAALLSAEADWEPVFNHHLKDVLALPQVANGTVSNQQAEKWLEVCTKQMNAIEVRKAIHAAKGLSERDVRALWAYEHNEYQSKFHASEVYALKQLKAVDVPDPTDRDTLLAEQLLSNLIIEKYELERVSLAKGVTGTAKKPNLYQSSPLVAENKAGTSIQLDVKVNFNQDVTQTDLIKHHVKVLSLLESQVKVASTFQYNIQINPDELRFITKLASSGSQGYEVAMQALRNLDEHDLDMQIRNEKVLCTREMFKDINSLSIKHWNSMMQGESLNYQPEEVKRLNGQQESVFQPLAKKYAAAQRLYKSAEANFEASRSDLIEAVSHFGQPQKLDSAFDLVKIGKREELDTDRVLRFLDRQNIPRENYSKTGYDIDGLVKAARARGIDTSGYQTVGSPIKEKMLTTLELLGVDTKEFMNQSNHIHFTGQSRGEVHERISNLEESTSRAIEEATTNIAKELTNQPQLDIDGSLDLDNSMEQN